MDSSYECTEDAEADCDYGLFLDLERGVCMSPRRGMYTASYGSCTLQLDAKQDFSTSGLNDDGGWYGVVADGHGRTSRVVELLRGMDWASVTGRTNPIEYVVERVAVLGETVRDGATLSVARVRAGRLELSWLGDSAMEFFVDGKRTWRSPIHSPNVPTERDAVVRRGGVIADTDQHGRPLWGIEAVTPTAATMVPINHTCLSSPSAAITERVTLTRCLGHNRLQSDGRFRCALRTDPQHHVLSLPPGKAGRLVMASDGLWDVLATSDRTWLARDDTTAELIAAKAQERWTQEWTYRFPHGASAATSSPKETRSRIGRPDDVSVVVWSGTG